MPGCGTVSLVNQDTIELVDLHTSTRLAGVMLDVYSHWKRDVVAHLATLNAVSGSAHGATDQ